MNDNIFNKKMDAAQFRKLQIYTILFLVINEMAWYLFYGKTVSREALAFPIFLLVLYFLKLVDFKMPKFKITDIFYVVGGYVAILALRIMMLMIEGDSGTTSANQAGLEGAFTFTGFTLVLVVFTTVIVAPVQEELLYRRMIMGNIFRKMPLLGVLASSLIFGGVHMFAGFTLIAFIDYSLTGLVFGLIYYKTRRLEVSIATHILNNSLSSIIMLCSIRFGWFM